MLRMEKQNFLGLVVLTEGIAWNLRVPKLPGGPSPVAQFHGCVLFFCKKKNSLIFHLTVYFPNFYSVEPNSPLHLPSPRVLYHYTVVERGLGGANVSIKALRPLRIELVMVTQCMFVTTEESVHHISL